MRARSIATLLSVVALLIAILIGSGGPVSAATGGGAPAVPTNLTITTTTAGGGLTPTLTWGGSEGAVEYAIWRDGDWYSWVKAPATTWSETNPIEGARYQLRALGGDGSWSKWTNPVTSTSLSGPPAVPTALTAARTSTGVVLNWAHSEGAVEYAIWRDGNWYSWIKAPATTWSDTNPVEGARYQLRALGADGSWSKWTNPVTPTDGAVTGGVDTTPPSVVSEPRVVGKRPGEFVEIDWLPATDDVGVDHYRIDYIDGAGIDTFTDTTTTTTTYRIDDDNIATFAVAYDHFVITAVDTAGNESEPTELWFTYESGFGDLDLGFTQERNAASRPADPVSLTASPPDVNDFNGPNDRYQSAMVTLKLPVISDNLSTGARLYRDDERIPGGPGTANECLGPDCTFGDVLNGLVTCWGMDCSWMFIDSTAVPGETYTYRVVGWDGYNESHNGVEITYTVPADQG